jgi:DNA (cytosine-5)-methyltransferase 1
MAEPRAFEGTVRSGGSPQRIDWGVYGPAIRRWEALTRPAPAPVDDRQRLAPAFVEWMMGYPAGWVTDVDVARTHQLKMLGNAVIPQQADLAWERLWAPLCNPNHEGAA